MKQHLGLGIIVAVSALMVFGTTAYVMPFVYASSGGSSTPGASGASASGTKGGAGGKGDNPGSSSSSTGSGSSSGSGSSTTPKTPTPKTPTPKTPTPKTPAPKTPAPKACVPGKCIGDPGYYTTNGHHHCFDGAKGCVCTDPHKCTVGSAFIRPDSIMTTV